jgi:RNA polymerase sigma-70 factor (ECF subfamily)
MEPFNPDPAFLEDFRQGDEQAFEKVFQRYYRPLCFFARKTMSDPSGAEEIASDAFVALYRRRDRIVDSTHLTNFLYTCVRNACISRERCRHRRPKPLDEAILPDMAFESAHELLIMRAETLQLIYEQAARMPERYRRIFELYYHEDKTTPEIADIMQLHPKTVRNLRVSC